MVVRHKDGYGGESDETSAAREWTGGTQTCGRSGADNDPDGNKVDTKWVVTQKKGTQAVLLIKARLIASEFAGGDQRNDLFAGTPGFSMLRYAVSQAAYGQAARGQVIMVLNIQSAFMSGEPTRRSTLSFPREIGKEETSSWSVNCPRRSTALAMPHSRRRTTSPPH